MEPVELKRNLQKSRTMPELPEIETIVRGLRRPLLGRRVVSARLRHASLYRRGSMKLNRLAARTVISVERVGKNAVIGFEPSALLLVNLGMTGRITLAMRTDAAETRHLHGRILFADGYELRYFDARRFGHFYLAESGDLAGELGIGPDPFIATPRYLRDTLSARAASIKALLLDQRILSGIGNIYADETLFRARIDPRTPGGEVAAKARRVLSSARVILQRAIDHGGSTIRDYRRYDGEPGAFQFHHAVYGRMGERCVRCESSIRKIVLGGRGTHFCPRCQR